MHFYLHALAALSLLLTFSDTSDCYARPGDAPVYARQRAGGHREGWNGGQFYGHRGGYGYYPNQPTIAGSWYARPYPYHFDYYRGRFSAPPQTPNCPCAEVQAQY